MKERLKSIMKLLKYSNVKLAKEAGVTEGTIRNILNGSVNTISQPILEHLAKHRVNLNWLLTGEGEMFIASGNGSSGSVNISGGEFGVGVISGNNNNVNITDSKNKQPHLTKTDLTDEELELVKSFRESDTKKILKLLAKLLVVGGVVGLVGYLVV
jgi:transcriptional regulator with XRE-family HTH domain